MASNSARRYAASIATVVAVTEKLLIDYSDRPGCGKLKLAANKLHKKSCEYLRIAVGITDSNTELQNAIFRNEFTKFTEDDLEKVSSVIAKCSEQGLDTTKSWRTLIVYTQGILANSRDGLKENNGSKVKIEMVLKLEKMCVPLYEHFASRTKRFDFDDDGVRLMNIFESCW